MRSSSLSMLLTVALADFDEISVEARPRSEADEEGDDLALRDQAWQLAGGRYRGLAKNAARASMMFALASLSRVRHRLRPRGVDLCGL